MQGRLNNTSGNQDNNSYNVKYSINANGEKVIDTTAMNYLTSNDITKNGTLTMDQKSETDINQQEDGTIGFRLAIFLTDVNRHSQYFEYKGDGIISLRDDVVVPENIVIPSTVQDNNKKQQKVKYVKCTGSTRIKTITDNVSEGIYKDAYKNCINLQSINLKYAVDIGESAFEGCENLAEINIQEKSKSNKKGSIGKNAFKNCNALKKFVSGQVKPVSCELKKSPNKLCYTSYFVKVTNSERFLTENFDITGCILTIKYSDGTQEDINLKQNDEKKNLMCDMLEFNGMGGSENVFLELPVVYSDGIKYSKKEISLQYDGMKVDKTFDIYVVLEKNYQNFEWGDLSRVKTEYAKGEEFDLQGSAISYNYTNENGAKVTDYVGIENKRLVREIENADGTTERTTYDNHEVADFWKSLIKVEGYNKNKLGEQEVTLIFEEEESGIYETKTFKVNVKDLKRTEQQKIDNNNYDIKDIQDYEAIYMNAFDGCENLERIIVGNVNSLSYFENGKKYSLTNNTTEKDKIEKSISELLKTLPNLKIIKMGDTVYKNN